MEQLLHHFHHVDFSSPGQIKRTKLKRGRRRLKRRRQREKEELKSQSRFSYFSYRRDYFRENLAKFCLQPLNSHVSIDVFSFLVARARQVIPAGSLVQQRLSLPVLTVGNAPVGNVPSSPLGGGLPVKRQNIAIFTSQFRSSSQKKLN